MWCKFGHLCHWFGNWGTARVKIKRCWTSPISQHFAYEKVTLTYEDEVAQNQPGHARFWMLSSIVDLFSLNCVRPNASATSRGDLGGVLQHARRSPAARVLDVGQVAILVFVFVQQYLINGSCVNNNSIDFKIPVFCATNSFLWDANGFAIGLFSLPMLDSAYSLCCCRDELSCLFPTVSLSFACSRCGRRRRVAETGEAPVRPACCLRQCRALCNRAPETVSLRGSNGKLVLPP